MTEVEQQGDQAGQAAVGSHQDSDKDWGGQSPRTGIMRIEGKSSSHICLTIKPVCLQSAYSV